MQVRKRNPFGGILVTICLLSASLAQAAEFTATFITKAGGMEIPGKVYVKGKKVRNEVQTQGQNIAHIIRPDKNLFWLVMPQQKAYMEMPITQEIQQKILSLSDKQKAEMKKIGTETVNNYVCDKYESTMPPKGGSRKLYIWVATELGIPIKMVAQDGSVSMEYTDIKTGELADSLFEPPQGYQKMKMPFSMPPMT